MGTSGNLKSFSPNNAHVVKDMIGMTTRKEKMNKEISITLKKELWMEIIQAMLKSRSPMLEMMAKNLTALVINQEELNELKKKANL